MERSIVCIRRKPFRFIASKTVDSEHDRAVHGALREDGKQRNALDLIRFDQYALHSIES